MTSIARWVRTVRYPATDHMGEHFLPRSIARWFDARRVKTFALCSVSKAARARDPALDLPEHWLRHRRNFVYESRR